MQTIRLLIINSKQSVRRGLTSLFTVQGGFDVVGEIESVADIDYLQRLQPDVALYGLSSHDAKSISVISSIKEVCPCTLIVAFSDLSERFHILAAFAAGADGYLKTPMLPADLVAAIKLICRSGICFFPRIAKETLINVKGFYKTRADNGESENTCV